MIKQKLILLSNKVNLKDINIIYKSIVHVIHSIQQQKL